MIPAAAFASLIWAMLIVLFAPWTVTMPGKICWIAVTRLSSALGKSRAMYPTTAKASARRGKNDRNPKYVTAPASTLPWTLP